MSQAENDREIERDRQEWSEGENKMERGNTVEGKQTHTLKLIVLF